MLSFLKNMLYNKLTQLQESKLNNKEKGNNEHENGNVIGIEQSGLGAVERRV